MRFHKLIIIRFLAVIVILSFSDFTFARMTRRNSTEVGIFINQTPGIKHPGKPSKGESRVLVLDCDGTLIDAHAKYELYTRAQIEVLNTLKMDVEGQKLTSKEKDNIKNFFYANLSTPTLERTKNFVQFLANGTSEEIYKEKYKNIVGDVDTIERLDREREKIIKERYGEVIKDGVNYQPGIVSVLETLQEKDVKIVLLSNTVSTLFEQETQIMGYLEYFDKVIGVGGTDSTKGEVIKQLKQEIGDGVYIMVGNSSEDKKAADAIEAIFVSYGKIEGASAWITDYNDKERIANYLLGEYP